MSELALNDYNEVRTAYSLRDEFLRFGTIYTQLNCAFCDVDLISVAVSPELSYVRAPHYRLANAANQHASDCAYAPGGLARYKIAPPVAKTHAFAVDLPECLIKVRPPRGAGTLIRPKPTSLATPTEILKRVAANLASAKVANQYTTSLLQTLVDARILAVKQLHNFLKNNFPNNAQRAAEVSKVLSTCDLVLYGDKKNYSTAFHKTNHTPWEGKFIYHGQASVQALPTGFQLTSTDKIPGLVPTAQIYVNCNTAAPVNSMESRTISILNSAVVNQATIFWHAYGELVLDQINNEYRLNVNSPEHITVRT